MEEGCIIIQTCDKYQPAWKSLFWSMEKYWDFKIPWYIYFCNEELDVDLPNERYRQIKSGRCSHTSMMKYVMWKLKDYKYIFYMLEDFWPTSHMTEKTFMGLFGIFKKNNWDSLKVTINHPERYELENTNFEFEGKKILKFARKSKWRFSQQASFWKRQLFEEVIDEPSTQNNEEMVRSSLGTEIAMDKKMADLFPEAEVYLFNYLWYPVGGSYWRGELTQIGQQIEFERKVEEYNKSKYR